VGFFDLDAAEQMLGKAVTTMSDAELVSYLKLSVQQRQGIKLAVDGQPERSIMAGLKRVYGTDAGSIIKWAVHHHHATMPTGRSAGSPLGFFAFTRGMKWFTDQLHSEFQQHRHLLAERQRMEHSAAAFTRLADL